jgi:hypothetical protein
MIHKDIPPAADVILQKVAAARKAVRELGELLKSGDERKALGEVVKPYEESISMMLQRFNAQNTVIEGMMIRMQQLELKVPKTENKTQETEQ